MRLFHRNAAAICLALAIPCVGCSDESVTDITAIMLVRHAEKAAGKDPPLTAAGRERAEALVAAVDGAALSAIYATTYQRTQLTAEPTARALSMTPVIFPVEESAEQHASDLAADILAKHAGGRVLVVGHSNTLPLIIEALGVESVPAIADSDYDDFFVVIKSGKGPGHLVRARYGDPGRP